MGIIQQVQWEDGRQAIAEESANGFQALFSTRHLLLTVSIEAIRRAVNAAKGNAVNRYITKCVYVWS
jgi:hypothetical protein